MSSIDLTINTRGAALLAVCIFSMTTATIAVGMRLWARKYKGTNFAADDYVTIFALIVLFGNGISECVAVTHGGRGLHQKELSHAQLEVNYKTLFAAQISWTLSTSAIKLSLLLLYTRVFPIKSFKIITCAMMVIVVAYCAGCLVAFLTNCYPFQANFTPWMSGARCVDPNRRWLWTGFANVFTDIAVLSLPMRNVWKLKLPQRTRVAVMGIFAIGFATVVISIARLIALVHIDREDFTHTAVPADILSALEPTFAISCACIPIMRPLFKHLFPSHKNPNQCEYYYRRNASDSAKRLRRSDIGMSVLTKSSSERTIRICGPASPGFGRMDEDYGAVMLPGKIPDWSLHFRNRSGTSTPTPSDGKQKGIEITTEIVVQRD